MEEKGRLIDLRQFFIYLSHRWAPVLIVAVVFAAGMLGYSYRKQNNSSVNVSLNAIRTQNQTAYFRGASVSLNTDADAPEGTYNSRVRLYVDFDISSYESQESIDLTTVNTVFQRDFQTVAVSYDLMEDVIEDLHLRDYDDMSSITGEELRWMVNRSFEGTHVFNLSVTDVDPERAQDIVTAIAEKLIDRADDFVRIKNIRMLDHATLETVRSTGVQISTKKMIKYGAVGFVGGIIVAVIFYLIVFIGMDVVMNRSDVEYAGTHLFGNVSRKNKDEEYKIIAACLQLHENVKTVVVSAVDKTCDAKELADKIQSCLTESGSDIQVQFANAIMNRADAITAAAQSDAVLLAAKREKTAVERIAEAVCVLNDVKVRILGTVLV
ncbi:MAG: hypothetical protein IKD88_04310 [Lachnospiraceae bacterium]|nr:hypothetical protein [Lachnospiraceae bacterium]